MKIPEYLNISLNMTAGLLPEHLTENEHKILVEQYGDNYFVALGYTEPEYKRCPFDRFNENRPSKIFQVIYEDGHFHKMIESHHCAENYIDIVRDKCERDGVPVPEFTVKFEKVYLDSREVIRDVKIY